MHIVRRRPVTNLAKSRWLAGRLVLAAAGTAAALGLWSSPPASAASVPSPWVQLTAPCADDTRFLGAGTQAWWAQCGGHGPDLKRSTDEGTTWQDVPLPGLNSLDEGTAEVGVDGTLYLAMRTDGYPNRDRLVKVNPTTGAVSGWDLPMGPAAVAFDRNREVWVAWCSYPDPNFEVQVSGIHMARVDGDGTVSDEASMAVADNSCSLTMDTDREGSLYLTRATQEVPNGPSKRILTHFAPSGTQLVGRSAPVVYDREGLAVTADGARVDGGPVFGAAPTSRGNGFIVFPGYWQSGDAVLQELQPGRLASMVPNVPNSRAMATPHGVFAFGDALLAYVKTPPPLPAGDPVPADSQAMVDEANRIRAQLNLVPLISDARIAQAAQNHAHYWTLNDGGAGLAAHDEIAGNPGFTGEGPSQRCQFAGYPGPCGEVMHAISDPVAAVRSWVATAFHRSWFAYPGVSRVGGGRSTGTWPVVMDADSSGYLGRPFGYPVGDYDLDLEFSGEIPDPAEVLCPGKISAPYGAAITVAVPSRVGELMSTASPFSVQTWTVTGPQGPVKGCSRDGIFVPDDALQTGSDYRVTVEWANPAQPPYSWAFRTAGEAPTTGTSQKKRSKPQLSPIRKNTQLRVTVRPNLGPKKQWSFKVQKATARARWKTVRMKTWKTQGKKHTRRINLGKGKYRVKTLAHYGYRGSTSKTVRLKG